MPFDASSRSLPFIEPLTLKIRRAPFDNPNWLFELKRDGFRGVLYFERKRGAQLLSRYGNVFGQFAVLAREAAKAVKADSAIIDGEIVATTEDDNPRFLELLRGRLNVSFVAFDVMWLDGRDRR